MKPCWEISELRSKSVDSTQRYCIEFVQVFWDSFAWSAQKWKDGLRTSLSGRPNTQESRASTELDKHQVDPFYQSGMMLALRERTCKDFFWLPQRTKLGEEVKVLSHMNYPKEPKETVTCLDFNWVFKSTGYSHWQSELRKLYYQNILQGH